MAAEQSTASSGEAGSPRSIPSSIMLVRHGHRYTVQTEGVHLGFVAESAVEALLGEMTPPEEAAPHPDRMVEAVALEIAAAEGITADGLEDMERLLAKHGRLDEGSRALAERIVSRVVGRAWKASA